MPAHADEATFVSLSEMAPLQMEAGFEHAGIKSKAWVEEATRVSEAEHRPFVDVLVEIIKRSSDKGISVYISPDGFYRPDDGHHKVLAAEELLDRYKIAPARVKWKVIVKGNFRGKTWEEYGEALQKLGAGHFPPDVLADSRARGETVGQLFQRLPRYFKMMRDSPMRSAMGRFYDSLGLEGAWLRPYSQFYMGEKLANELGVRVERGTELSEATLLKFREFFFAPDREAAAWRAALLNEARPEFRDIVARKIDETAAFLSQQASRALVNCVKSGLQ